MRISCFFSAFLAWWWQADSSPPVPRSKRWSSSTVLPLNQTIWINSLPPDGSKNDPGFDGDQPPWTVWSNGWATTVAPAISRQAWRNTLTISWTTKPARQNVMSWKMSFHLGFHAATIHDFRSHCFNKIILTYEDFVFFSAFFSMVMAGGFQPTSPKIQTLVIVNRVTPEPNHFDQLTCTGLFQEWSWFRWWSTTLNCVVQRLSHNRSCTSNFKAGMEKHADDLVNHQASKAKRNVMKNVFPFGIPRCNNSGLQISLF